MAVLASLFLPWKIFLFFSPLALSCEVEFHGLNKLALVLLNSDKIRAKSITSRRKIPSRERTDWDIISNVPSLLPGKIA